MQGFDSLGCRPLPTLGDSPSRPKERLGARPQPHGSACGVPGNDSRGSWREGTTEWLSSRFARVRVRAAHRDYNLTDSRPEEWLLIEWPKGEDAPTKYWLSTLPQNITFRSLVDLTKLRWRNRARLSGTQTGGGLGHFEGRGWRGFHHHATLCIAAYGFLVSERETIPPPQLLVPSRCSRNLPYPRLSTQRLCPCGLNVISPTPSQLCAGD